MNTQLQKHAENGFGAVAVIAIIAVVVIVGATGYVVYGKHQTATKASVSTTAPATSASTPTSTSDSTATSKQSTDTSSAGALAALQKLAVAFKSQNKADVDAFVSPFLLSKLSNSQRASGFYASCIQSASECSDLFTKPDFSSLTPKVTTYTADNGDTGLTLTYHPNGNSSSFENSSSVEYNLVQKGGKWLLYDFNGSLN